jgi:prolyl oligopeptidase family protein
MAAEITGFNVGVPEARNEQQHGNQKNGEDIARRRVELPKSSGGRQGSVGLAFFDIADRWGGHFQVFYRPIGLSAPGKFISHKSDCPFKTPLEGGEMRSTIREVPGSCVLKLERGICLCLATAVLLGTSPLSRAQESAGTCPPKTRVDIAEDKYGKTVVVDPYRWLEDQESKETREWIEAQDRCTEAALRKLPGRESITKRMTELYRVDSYGLPEERGGRYFFTKRLAGQDLEQIWMRQSTKGEARVAPLHARKMAARLQAATESERPILLLYDTKSGHSGGRPVNKRIEEGTDALSFLMWQLKVGGN